MSRIVSLERVQVGLPGLDPLTTVRKYSIAASRYIFVTTDSCASVVSVVFAVVGMIEKRVTSFAGGSTWLCAGRWWS